MLKFVEKQHLKCKYEYDADTKSDIKQQFTIISILM